VLLEDGGEFGHGLASSVRRAGRVAHDPGAAMASAGGTIVSVLFAVTSGPFVSSIT